MIFTKTCTFQYFYEVHLVLIKLCPSVLVRRTAIYRTLANVRWNVNE